MFVSEGYTVGDVMVFQGQPYTLREIRSYIRRDGLTSVLYAWEAPCATCGSLFEFVAPGRMRWPNRRCYRHHKPGLPVIREKLHE
jgi:hypothetical protein